MIKTSNITNVFNNPKSYQYIILSLSYCVNISSKETWRIMLSFLQFNSYALDKLIHSSIHYIQQIQLDDIKNVEESLMIKRSNSKNIKETTKNKEEKDDLLLFYLRGIVFFIGMSSWGSQCIKKAKSSANNFIYALQTLKKIVNLPSANIMIIYELILSLNRLIKKYGHQLKDNEWNMIFQILFPTTIELFHNYPDSNLGKIFYQIISNIYDIIAIPIDHGQHIENNDNHIELTNTNSNSQRYIILKYQHYFYSLIINFTSILPSKLIFNYINQFSIINFQPIVNNWITSIALFFTNFFIQGENSLKYIALKKIELFLKRYKYVYSNEIIESVILPSLKVGLLQNDIEVNIETLNMIERIINELGFYIKPSLYLEICIILANIIIEKDHEQQLVIYIKTIINIFYNILVIQTNNNATKEIFHILLKFLQYPNVKIKKQVLKFMNLLSANNCDYIQIIEDDNTVYTSSYMKAYQKEHEENIIDNNNNDNILPISQLLDIYISLLLYERNLECYELILSGLNKFLKRRFLLIHLIHIKRTICAILLIIQYHTFEKVALQRFIQKLNSYDIKNGSNKENNTCIDLTKNIKKMRELYWPNSNISSSISNTTTSSTTSSSPTSSITSDKKIVSSGTTNALNKASNVFHNYYRKYKSNLPSIEQLRLYWHKKFTINTKTLIHDLFNTFVIEFKDEELFYDTIMIISIFQLGLCAKLSTSSYSRFSPFLFQNFHKTSYIFQDSHNQYILMRHKADISSIYNTTNKLLDIKLFQNILHCIHIQFLINQSFIMKYIPYIIYYLSIINSVKHYTSEEISSVTLCFIESIGYYMFLDINICVEYLPYIVGNICSIILKYIDKRRNSIYNVELAHRNLQLWYSNIPSALQNVVLNIYINYLQIKIFLILIVFILKHVL